MKRTKWTGQEKKWEKKNMYGSVIAGMSLVRGQVIDISKASSVSLYRIHIPLSLFLGQSEIEMELKERDIECFTDCCWVENHSILAMWKKEKEQLDRKKVIWLEHFLMLEIMQNYTSSVWSCMPHCVNNQY